MLCIYLYVTMCLVMENTGKEMFIITEKTWHIDPENQIGIKPSQTEFFFRVKACLEPMIYITCYDRTRQSTYQVQLLLWSHRRNTFIRDVRQYPKKISGLFYKHKYSHFTEMWIKILGDMVSFGSGTIIGHGQLVQMKLTSTKVQQMAALTPYSTGQWEFRLPVYSNHQITQQWKVLPGIPYANMTRDVVMTTETGTFPDCAKACKAHHDCLSFVFNSESHACQGHSDNFKSLEEGDGHLDKTAIYFYCVRRVH